LNINGIIIAGPTASGKTKIAKQISSKFPSTIINADSMQVYEDLQIITNRPSNKEINKFNYKLFGVLKTPTVSSLGWWVQSALKEIKICELKGKMPIIVGGTGLYLKGLVDQISFIPKVPNKIRKKVRAIHKVKGNYFLHEKLKKIDPISFKEINKNDSHRLLRAIEVKVFTGKNINYWKDKKKSSEMKNKKFLFIVIKTKRDDLYKSINKRFDEMIENGVLTEVKSFFAKKVPSSHPLNKAIGLKHINNFLEKKTSIQDMKSLSKQDTRNYAKRQITWFNHQPLNPIYLEFDQVETFIMKNLKNFNF
tara:strand:- start:95 stop:1018 length:924 start_codon:yes stop_codon:yes gene_type:complete